MAIEYISDERKNHMKVAPNGQRDERVYLDFRRVDYPPLAGSNLEYNWARPDYNMPGSASAFIGTANYPSDGLVAHYTMDNVTGTTLTDDFGANNGTITGAVQVAGVPGLGRALRFDGVDDVVSTSSFDASTNSEITISVWVNPKVTLSTPASNVWFASYYADISNRFGTFFSNTGALFSYAIIDGVAFSASYNTTLISDTWYHITAIISDSSIKLYLDGVVRDETAITTTVSNIGSSIFNIGAFRSGQLLSGNNDIDDVRIYNRALTETEIEYLYNVRTNVLSDIEPDYLVEMPETFTLRLVVRPWFDFDTGANKRLLGWRLDATNRFTVYYDRTNDSIQIRWNDGGTERFLSSSQLDDGTSFTDLNQWLTIDIAIDLSTGTTAGSQLWINRTSQDTTWTGNISAKVSNFQIVSVGHTAGAVNAQTEYAYCMLIPNYVATDADIQNDYKDVTNEAIVWDFNGEGVGRTMVNVTPYVTSTNKNKTRENAVGSFLAKRGGFSLKNQNGEFSDDQYATYDPANGSFNGLTSQKYLQNRSRVWFESIYGGERETTFFGELDSSRYSRTSRIKDISRVNVSVIDGVSRIARKALRRGRQYEDYYLVDTDESNSLVHTIVRLSSQAEIFNYLGNSGFENAMLANSWSQSGLTATRNTAEEFIGTACVELDSTGGAGEITQTATFTGNLQLLVGQTWLFQIKVKAASTPTIGVEIEERDSLGLNAESTDSVTIAATQDYYQTLYVTHTITDPDSDRLTVRITQDVGFVSYVDTTSLVLRSTPLNWDVETSHDGTAGVTDADDVQFGAYDTIGFQCEPVLDFEKANGTLVDAAHPWTVIERNTSLWEYVKQIGDAVAARRFGLDAAGMFQLRSPIGGWSDPENLGEITRLVAVGTRIDPQLANRIIVHGVRIVKAENDQIFWSLRASRAFDDAVDGESDDQAYLDVANGDYYPDADDFPRFIAKFGKV